MQLSTVLADEHYEQEYTEWSIGTHTPVPQRRTVDSDFLFLRLPGNGAWLGLRDTYRVDGTDVRDADAGFLPTLRTGGANEFAEAKRIATDNARSNLGDIVRTINVPTTTLDFLTERYRSHFRFSKSGEERSRGHVSWVLHFDETARPTIVRTVRGANQRARGTISVDPLTGAVERTVLDLGDDSRAEEFVKTRISVTYAPEPSLGMLVPVEMVESYYRPATHEFAQLQIDAHATYSRFRRFQVSARILEPPASH